MKKQNPSRLDHVCQSLNRTLASQNSTKRLREDEAEGASARQVRVWLKQTYTDQKVIAFIVSYFTNVCFTL